MEGTRKVLTPPSPTSPYDNGIYQALTTELPALTVAASELPDFCCRARGEGEDGRYCRRTALIFHLWSDYADLMSERARHPRLRSDYRKRNLAGWIEFAERRLRHHLSTWELPECNGDEARRLPEGSRRDVELALPACTC